ncbi:MAG: methyltransferase [Actinobacteria bacterium]|nr:methyltransferase [Actinomycetota bacterium]
MPDSGEHYFSSQPATGSRRRTVTLALPDLTVELETDRGVFSADRIDPGTKHLLREVSVAGDAKNVLDLGTGYGPIAVALAMRLPAATIWATEVNERAAALAEVNAGRAGVAERVHVVRVREDDDRLAAIPDSIAFDAVFSNPPIRVGKARLHSSLSGALGRMSPTGRAYLVVQKHLGSDSLQRWLSGAGWPTVRLGSRAGYRILCVSRARP